MNPEAYLAQICWELSVGGVPKLKMACKARLTMSLLKRLKVLVGEVKMVFLAGECLRELPHLKHTAKRRVCWGGAKTYEYESFE